VREYPLKFEEGINRGLRQYSKMPKNYQSLTEAVNFRVTKRGPEVPPTILTPATWAALGTTWPYPRVFRTGHRYYLLDDGDLYAINPDTLALDFPLIAGISTFGYWAMADFGDMSIFVDGGPTGLYYTRSFGDTGGEAIIGTYDFDGARAICNFKQQLLMGGFGHGTYGVNYGWAPDQGLQWRNVVFWSPIGSITEDNDLIDPGVLPGFLEEVHDYLNWIGGKTTGGEGPTPVPFSNVSGWGFAPMRYNGYVWNLKPLHSHIIAYGSNGIAALTPHSAPVPTFGYKHLADFGIVGSGAVGGDENKHIFVDESGNLWKLTDDLKLEKLGYAEYLAPLKIAQFDSGAGGYKILVSHDTELDDFYISNGAKTYLLGESGLSEIKLWHPTSLFRDKGQLYGITVAGSSTIGSMASDTLDMGLRGIKIVSSMELGGDATGLEATLDYRYASGNAYSSGTFKPATRAGQVTPMLGGIEFRAKARNADYTKFNPDYINMRWKASDKRAIRGPYEASHGKTVSRSSS
jgi:hypothetical protein